ncbi:MULTISPECIES: YsgD/CorL family protein [Pantoea]
MDTPSRCWLNPLVHRNNI